MGESAYSTSWSGDNHLRICRIDGEPVSCSWDVLQAIKDEVLGPEACAVEMFPPADEIVDEANIRHLWIVDVNSVPSLLRRDRAPRVQRMRQP